MLHRDYTHSNISYKYDSSSDNEESDTNSQDPGLEVIEKNARNRLQRIANQTKEELDKVLKRVDTTLSNYEYSVQSSLIQHGMARDDSSNVEHVNDIKELEDLLNDSLAKQRYKQRLMIFIVGQTEQVNEKAQLLQQIGQFFIEQKQNFSAKEFNTFDELTETQIEIDQALKSFDVKNCFFHVKELGTRLNELNEQVIEYLIQNAAAKQQSKGKKKGGQIPKEIKEQISSLQSKLDSANIELSNRDDRIQSLEEELTTLRNEINVNLNDQKILNDQLNQRKEEIESYKNNIQEYLDQIDDLKKVQSDSKEQDTINTTEANEKDNKPAQISVSTQIDKQEFRLESFSDKEIQTVDYTKEIIHHSEQTSSDNIEDMADLNLLFNSTDGIDLNHVTNENLPTVFSSLRSLAISRVKELLKELEVKEATCNEKIQNLKQQFDEYKLICEEEKKVLIERVESSSQLQIQTEEPTDQLALFNSEPRTSKNRLVERETQTEQEDTLDIVNLLPEQQNPQEELSNDQFLSPSKITSEENESIVKCPPTSLVDEENHGLNQVVKQTNIVSLLSLGSMEEKIQLQSLETASENNGIMNNEYLPVIIEEQQQTPRENVQNTFEDSEKITPESISTDSFKVAFFHLYDNIYRFRHAIVKLLEQNKFQSFADRLDIIQELSSDNHIIDDFIKNSECLLKDTVKILQICLITLQSTINQYQSKEKEIKIEPEPIQDKSIIDNQQASILQEKEFTIIDLTSKYEHATKILNETNEKHKEILNENEITILDQQKSIRSLRYEILHLQKYLRKVEAEGIMEPSVMFTRLDAEQNEKTLQNAVEKGKVPETTYYELNKTMTDYVRLPSLQFSNLVKRYIQFRKAVAIENHLTNYAYDHGTKRTLQKIESLHERRSTQISELISHIRQQRAILARTLTEKFDHLEDQSNIFLIRPVYSYQGRAATQCYMQYDKHRREALLPRSATKKKHYTSRQSMQSQSSSGDRKMAAQQSSIDVLDNDEPQFHVDKSFAVASSVPTSQTTETADMNNNDKKTIQLSELTRLQEIDIQRSLMPMTHASTTLLSAFTNNSIDPCVPSLNLRSYVALTRPGISSDRMRKPIETMTRISRESVSTFSAKSRERNPRTPYNSTAGDLKRMNSPLPPIKRPLLSNISSTINEKQQSGFISPLNINEVATTT